MCERSIRCSQCGGGKPFEPRAGSWDLVMVFLSAILFPVLVIIGVIAAWAIK